MSSLAERLLSKRLTKTDTSLSSESETLVPPESTSEASTEGSPAQAAILSKFGDKVGLLGGMLRFLPGEWGSEISGLFEKLSGPAAPFHAEILKYRNLFQGLLEMNYEAGIGNRDEEQFRFRPHSAEGGAHLIGGPNPVGQNDAERSASHGLAQEVLEEQRSLPDRGLETQIPGAVDAAGPLGGAVLPQVEAR